MTKFSIRKSPISGRGLFAVQKITAGEVVVTWHPKVLTKDQAMRLSEDDKHFLEIQNGEYLFMQPPERYLNHSCEPNTKVGNKCDVALRDIQPGDEITSDYFEGKSLKFICTCGSSNCRRPK